VNDDSPPTPAAGGDATPAHDRTAGRGTVSRWIYRAIGAVSFSIGAMGLVLPGLPTTGFWLIAAFCFARSSPAVCLWIYKRGRAGEMIRLILEEGSLTRPAKRRASAGILLGIGVSTLILHLTDNLTTPVAIGLAVSIPIALLVVWRCFRTIEPTG